MHLKRVSFVPDHEKQEYPYGLPLFKESFTLSFEAPLTILAGENGTGKSTLLEAIAEQSGLIRVASVEDDDINEEIRRFSLELKLSWSAKKKKVFT
ncbi:AAA family ATPase [Metabacillus idriensis]|uniref:AAA family ATPase n=1 Tax=Metabacillus idriensis TaxID=324768 RepID=UPI001CD5AC95|nr:AAA family ATPase [Metabacillus idriensis]